MAAACEDPVMLTNNRNGRDSIHNSVVYIRGDENVVCNFMRLIISLAIILFSVSGCHDPGDSRSTGKEFKVTVQGFALTAGYSLKYQIDEGGISVVTNCDFEGCKPETKYKRDFTVGESDELYQFLKSLRIDTLKNNYTQDGVLDGYAVTISIEGAQLPTKDIELRNLQTRTTARLLNKVNGLVTEEKYKFGKWPE